VYGVGGAVEDYLLGQGVAPFFEMGDTYGEMAAGSLGSALLDIDATVDAYCAQHNCEKPTDVDELAELHLKAALEWLQTLETE
jgi:hypothetical protein